jgi:drug/metabolite transporter (DMT)-like permease
VPDALVAARRRLDAFGRRVPTAPVMLAVLLYSTGPVMAQATSVSGPVFSFWRLWFGVLVLGAATLVHGGVTGRWPVRGAWGWSLGAGAAFGVHQLLLFSAIKATTVADVTLVGTLSPVVTALIAWPFFRERPGTPFRLWSLVAMAGTAVVVAGASTSPEGDPVGMVLALANVVAFAAFFLVSKGSRERLDVLPFLFGVMIVAAVLVSAYVAVTAEAIGTATARDLVLCLIVALVPGALGHFVMTWPLGWIPANVPPVLRLGVPVFAALWAWWLLGEPITVWHLTGGVVTIGGVAGAVLSPSGRQFVAGAPPDGSPARAGE